MSDAPSGEPLRDLVDGLQREIAALRRSRRRLVESADADRRALERAVHDGIQQHLVALAGDLRRLAGLIDRDPSAAKAMLDHLVVSSRDAMDEGRALAQRIYPPRLQGRGLITGLRSAAASAGVALVVETPSDPVLPPTVAAAVYWSCLDAFESASPGSEATVTLAESDGAITFEIAISGRMADGRRERLRDRIEALDGRIDVEDATDSASRIHGRLPLPA